MLLEAGRKVNGQPLRHGCPDNGMFQWCVIRHILLQYAIIIKKLEKNMSGTSNNNLEAVRFMTGTTAKQ